MVRLQQRPEQPAESSAACLWCAGSVGGEWYVANRILHKELTLPFCPVAILLSC